MKILTERSGHFFFVLDFGPKGSSPLYFRDFKNVMAYLKKYNFIVISDDQKTLIQIEHGHGAYKAEFIQNMDNDFGKFFKQGDKAYLGFKFFED
jgi:hypothetical protein